VTDRQSYSPDEIAERHGISRSTVWRLMQSGELGYRKSFGRLRRITLEDEKRWLDGLPPIYPQARVRLAETRRNGMRRRTAKMLVVSAGEGGHETP
jgi:excisionase family DNA binding protein